MTDQVEKEEGKEDWMQQKWRPAMGWLYMAVCAFDFMLAPILWSLLQAVGNHGHVESQWQPLTLQGAGLFHVAMGAVLGIAAYGRTQEKMAGVSAANGQPIGPVPAPSFGAASAPTPSFGSPVNSTPPAFGSAPTTPAPSFGAKPAGPGPTSFPAL